LPLYIADMIAKLIIKIKNNLSNDYFFTSDLFIFFKYSRFSEDTFKRILNYDANRWTFFDDQCLVTFVMILKQSIFLNTRYHY